MKPILLAAALAFSGLLTAPLATLAAPPLNMTVTFSPNPPRQGTETITVMLTNGAHKPVSGAHVTVATNMPTMSMSGPTVVAAPKGNGRYVASVKVAFATRWAFTVAAKSNGKTVSRTVMQDVK